MTNFTLFLKTIAVLGLLLVQGAVSAQSLFLKANFHSIGYRIELPPDYDTDSTATVAVRYRVAGQDWQQGFPPTRLTLDEFRGSLFQLKAATSYEIELSIVDSFPAYKKDTLLATVATRSLPDIQPSGNILWVSPNGSGTDYTADNPGSLPVLISAGLPCGTTVLLKGGNYTLGDMSLNLTEDCPESAPITIMAAPGETPTFDGGDYTPHTWIPDSGDANIWWTALDPALDFNALCLVDGERMYPYAFLTPPKLDTTYPSLQTLGYGLSGFYRNKQHQVFIKTLDHKNPNNSEVIFSKKFRCLTVNGNHKNVRLRIKGIHFKYYGKGSCSLDFLGNPIECYHSITLYFKNISQVTVDSCTFDFSNSPVYFGGDCNDNTVMNCHITDGTGYWSHAAFKNTMYTVPGTIDGSCGTFGRYLENVGIYFRPSAGQTVQGNVVWNNTIQGVVDGIDLGYVDDKSTMENCDIYENKISWCFDAIDPVGEQRNARVWGNEISYCPIGVSLISGGQKPVFIFRNVFHHLDQRQNYQTDPNFVDCNNMPTHQSWSTALKLNAGGTPAPNDRIYFIHNTVHGIEPYAFNLYLWQPAWKTLQMRNNLFYTEGEANFFFEGVANQHAYSFESRGDNVLNASGGAVGIIRPFIGGSNQCAKYTNPDSLAIALHATTGSPLIFLENTLSEPPLFVDPDHGDFHLQPGSPLIDQGLPVPGFNQHFMGAAPDIGAFELPDSTLSLHSAGLPDMGMHIFPNPSNGAFFIRFQAPPDGVADVQVRDLQGRLCAERHFSGLLPGSQTVGVDLPVLPAGVYFLTLRLAGRTAAGRLVIEP